MNSRADHNHIRVLLRSQTDDLLIGPAFGYVRDCVRPVLSRQLRHPFLHVAAQARERREAAFRKEDRDLFKIVADNVEDMKFGAHLVSYLSGKLSCRRRRRPKVCCKQDTIEMNLRSTISVFYKITLRRSDCQNWARRFSN